MDDIKIRVIDSNKLIEAINTGSYEINLSAVMALGAMVAQPASQWIPCSERLPEYGVEVLTINKDDEYEINHIIDEEDGEWFLDGVVAWMPLPKKWERGQDDG